MNGTATTAAIDIMREEIGAASVESRKAYHALADAEKAERELRRKLRLLEKQAGLHNTTTTTMTADEAFLERERKAEAAFDAEWSEGFAEAEYCAACGCESVHPMGQRLRCRCAC